MMTTTGKNIRSLSFTTALLLCLLSPCFNSVQATELPRVFIVHSYDPENLASNPQDSGLVKGFAVQGFVEGETVTIKRFYMDTKRTYTKPEQVEARGKEAPNQSRSKPGARRLWPGSRPSSRIW